MMQNFISAAYRWCNAHSKHSSLDHRPSQCAGLQMLCSTPGTLAASMISGPSCRLKAMLSTRRNQSAETYNMWSMHTVDAEVINQSIIQHQIIDRSIHRHYNINRSAHGDQCHCPLCLVMCWVKGLDNEPPPVTATLNCMLLIYMPNRWMRQCC